MNMENCKKIFIGNEVIVKLTDEGLNMLCCNRSLEEVKKYFGEKLNLETKEVRLPLGDLINIFGEYPFMEGFLPFEDEYIYIPDENLE
ncbi:MAG: hypothetical protein J6M60_07285 [Clostridia bacterium]|nr:hypothetical protein [Clostridia bacterium]